jgi:hypothetical protein
MNVEYVYLIFRCSPTIVDYDDDNIVLEKISNNEDDAKQYTKIKDEFYFYKYIKIKINDICNINLTHAYNSIVSNY